MAAPTVPTGGGGAAISVGFYQDAINTITILSNLALPTDADTSVTDAISGTTAASIVRTLIAQRDLL